jgi:Family of unknown function (DUF6941)
MADLLDVISPCVSIAVVCKSFRQDPDGSVTIEGIYDALRVESRGVITVTAVVLVHGGHLIGEHRISLVVKDPLGNNASDRMGITVLFRSVDAGEYARLRGLKIHCGEAGAYWFEVSLDDHVMLRRPIHVEIRA